MQPNIGQAAGYIWEMLSQEDRPVNITDVPKKTRLSVTVAYQGLGWLAREGKLQYSQKGRSTYVSLSGVACVC